MTGLLLATYVLFNLFSVPKYKTPYVSIRDVCLPVCLFVCPFVSLSVCPSICPSFVEISLERGYFISTSPVPFTISLDIASVVMHV